MSRRLSEATDPYIEKKIDPALMTFQEYYALVNPKDKFHPDNAYEMDVEKMNSFGDPKDQQYPTLIRTIKVHNVPFEIRMNKEDRFLGKFIKHTPDGEILRDEHGNPIYYTRDELMRSDKRRWEYSFAVYQGDNRIAYTADEWGCMLVAVASEYRGWGFGPMILKMARTVEPGKTSGGFTPAGYYNITKVYREFVRDYLKSGMYSFLVKSGQLSVERAKAIIQSAQQAYQAKKVDKPKYNLNTNNPQDWLLYVGEAGDFILYDRKLKDLIDKGVIDSEEFSHWVDDMIIGSIYMSGHHPYNHIHQFGGKTEQIKIFMMRLGLSMVAEHQEVLIFSEEFRKYVTQQGVEIIDKNEARLVSGPIAYQGMATAERQWRRSFDRYDEFKNRLLELAYGKYQITR
jgi:hypothetical protein